MIQQSGHFFEFRRGQWVKEGNCPATFYTANGTTYVGSLTLEQRLELDALITNYLKSLEKT